MQITGYFKDINNKNQYNISISSTGSGLYEIKDDTTGHICFASDPISISCDYSDTFNHIIIKSATVNLLTNINLKDIVLANNNRDISMTITATNLDNNTTTTLFSGYVEPLCFNEPYAYQWEQIQITATDTLASSQYIKYPPVMLEDYDPEEDEVNPWDDMWTTTQTLTKIADKLDLTLDLTNLSNDITTAMTSTKISNSIWIGTSEDDFKTCFEVLETLGKYWNVWFIVDGDNLVGFDWHNVTRTDVNLTKNDAADTDTNLSNSDAYTQVKLACNIEDADAILQFGEDLESPYTHYALYLEELVSEGGGSHAFAAYKDLMLNGRTIQEGKKNSYIYKNFCWVKKSNLWDFGQYGYTQFLPDDNSNGQTQQYILNWLRNNRGKAAFVSFGRTDKSQSTDNAPINSIALKDYLIISVMGTDNVNDSMSFTDDICSFKGSSTAFTPPDSDTTNYIVISGQVLLNKLYAQTGIGMHAKYQENGGGEYEDVNGNVGADSRNNYESALYHLQHGDFALRKKTVQRIGKNGYGCYYNHKFYDGAAGLETYSSTQCLYGDLKQDKYNKTMKYEYSFVDGQGKRVDNTSKIPVLECQLKIGNKYCVERLDLGPQGWGKFEWLTEEEIQTRNIKIANAYWYNFTIGIDPKCDDYIIGQTYDIQNTIWYYDDIEGKGTAIPIKFSDALSGPVSFKIVKPFNITWEKVHKSVHGWLWTNTHWSLTYQPILEKLSSIMLSDFKIDLVSDKGKIRNNTANNDLVYASDMNDKYIEPHEDDVDICTMITSQEAADWGTDMVISKSHVVNNNGTPFYGFETEDEDHNTIYVKPEQLYVDGFYQEYFTPRTIVQSTILFRHNYDWMLNPTKYKFNIRYVENDAKYVPISYETNLKYNRMTMSFKDMKYKAYEE